MKIREIRVKKPLIMKIISTICLLFFLIACAEKPIEKTRKYFDIKALFASQIVVLGKEKSIFKKEISINGEKEIKELSAINWEKELDPFLQSDINKPAFLQSYEIVETDSTLRYLLKAGEKQPISSIWMMKKRNSKDITYIEIAASSENLLYSWNKTLIAIFKNGFLQKYSVIGDQKILVFDQENYQIIGQRK